MRILIAEDETIIRLDLREMLEKAGFDVCAEAKDGEEAVTLARTLEPDLALLDVKMPKLDGIEAARRILEERPIPIVMVTAYGEAELVSRAVEAGVFGAAAAISLFVIPISAFSQSIQVGPGGVRIDDGRGRGGQCEELRRACENKDRLGEQGEGNCRRYRETCRGGR